MLGPILFTLYMLPLRSVRQRHRISLNCYFDDRQLYLSIKPDETDLQARIQACLKDIKNLMTSIFLLINSDKTKVNVLGNLKVKTIQCLFIKKIKHRLSIYVKVCVREFVHSLQIFKFFLIDYSRMCTMIHMIKAKEFTVSLR